MFAVVNTCEKLMLTISARIEYKHTQNMQTSQGYVFRTLQYLVTKFCNFSNINKFFMGIYFFLPRTDKN
jgi:hypothetical protein